MSDLPQFILARIAEDESSMTGRAVDARWVDTGSGPLTPARVLAECEAKRRIVEIATDQIRLAKDDAGGWDNWHEMAAQTLQALALPYADHPDYDESWRP